VKNAIRAILLPFSVYFEW